jgi:hypothetical protein
MVREAAVPELDPSGRFLRGRCGQSEEAISPARQGLNEPWIVGVIPQGLPNFVDSFVKPMLEIDERVLRPELLMEFLTGDNLAGFLQQGDQHLERLTAKLELQPCSAKFAGMQIYLEVSEAKDSIRGHGCDRPNSGGLHAGAGLPSTKL